VGSDVDKNPMALRRPWTVEIKEGIAVTACNKAHVFPRHARVLSRRLQDVRADDVIMIYKLCGQVLQHHATVLHRAADRSKA
jgi:hypothetical protein